MEAIDNAIAWYQGLPQAAQIGIPIAAGAGILLVAKYKKGGATGTQVTGPVSGDSSGGGGGINPLPSGTPPPPIGITGGDVPPGGGGTFPHPSPNPGYTAPGSGSTAPTSTGGGPYHAPAPQPVKRLGIAYNPPSASRQTTGYPATTGTSGGYAPSGAQVIAIQQRALAIAESGKTPAPSRFAMTYGDEQPGAFGGPTSHGYAPSGAEGKAALTRAAAVVGKGRTPVASRAALVYGTDRFGKTETTPAFEISQSQHEANRRSQAAGLTTGRTMRGSAVGGLALGSDHYNEVAAAEARHRSATNKVVASGRRAISTNAYRAAF